MDHPKTHPCRENQERQAHQDEIRRLQEAGALGESEYRRRDAKLKRDMASDKEDLLVCDKMLGFIDIPEMSNANGETNAASVKP